MARVKGRGRGVAAAAAAAPDLPGALLTSRLDATAQHPSSLLQGVALRPNAPPIGHLSAIKPKNEGARRCEEGRGHGRNAAKIM